MSRLVFINLPVEDPSRSIAFFKAIGFDHNPRFSDETGACIVISDVIHVMVLQHEKFKTFTPKAIADASKTSEVLNALSCESRAEVDDLVKRAVAAGGALYGEPRDHGFMYEHGFQDPDGHIWELFHMDMNSFPKN
jgi:predicted lactoylglutathione lyase